MARQFGASRSGAILASAVLLAPAAAEVARAQDAPTVVEITFQGNKRYSDDTLRLMLRTKVGQKLDEALIPEDVSALQQYFQAVDLKQETVEGGVRLLFTVVESAPVVQVDVVGVDHLSESDVRGVIETSAGRPIADFRLANDRRKIERLYRSKGHHFVQVTPRTEDMGDGKRVVFEILEGPEVGITSIQFTGNDAFPKEKLLERAVMRESSLLGLIPGPYVEETVRQDLLSIRYFYRFQGWLDAEVRLDDVVFSDDREDATVRIHVEEGPVYRIGEITFEGVRNYPGGVEALRELLALAPGDRMNRDAVGRAAEAVERAYRGEGFYAVVVTPDERIRTDERVADLVFRVEEASKVRVRALHIAGNVVTQDKVIRREIPLAPGDILNQNAIDKGVRKLQGLGYFDRVTSRVEPLVEGEDPNLRDVTFEVDDTAPTGSISFGVAANSDTGLSASFRISKRNFDWRDATLDLGEIFRGRAFTGAGQSLVVELSPGADYSQYRLAFTEPWMFDKPISFGWDLFLTQFRRFDYDQDARGIDFFLGRRWTWEGREKDTVFGVQGRTRVESHEVDNVDFDSTPTAFLSEGSNSLLSEELTLRLSSLDRSASPREGWYAEVSSEAGFAGDIRLWRNSVEGRKYWLLWLNDDERPHILSLGAKLAVAQPLGSSDEAAPNLLDEEYVPIYESYFAGGTSSTGAVRGFEYGGAGPHGRGDPFLRRAPGETAGERNRRLGRVAQSILENRGDPMGGRMQFVTSAEYTFPVYEDILRGVLFCDAGMARDSFSSAHPLDRSEFDRLLAELGSSGSPVQQALLRELRGTYDDGESFFSDMRVAVGFGIRIRIPMLGPVPLALDIGIPVREQDGDDTQIISFSVRRDF